MHVNASNVQGHATRNPASPDGPARGDSSPAAGWGSPLDALDGIGPVIGQDGSGAPLPHIGPYDFSSAVRVSGVPRMGSAGSAVRVSLAHAPQHSPYVVKACPSAGHAAQEWLASRLFGALGLATPTAVLAKGCSQVFDGTHAPERWYLATVYLPVYENLGDWLEGDTGWRVIDGARDGACDDNTEALRQARADARDAGQRMETVLAQSGGVPFYLLEGVAARAYADALRERNEARDVLCRSLPDVYQCALERQYVAALWLGNWDLCNVFMENVGVWRDKNDLPYMMTIDFGACLDLGFQGTCKENGYDVAVGQRQSLASLPSLTSTFRREAAGFSATLQADALVDLTQFPYGEHYALFVRRLAEWRRDVPNRAVMEELKNPTGVRALAAEMAYRLGRISAQEVRPWVESARDVAGGEALAANVPLRDSDVFVDHLLTRRDSLVQLLGGTWAAQAWAHAYPMRARAIDAQQEPFGYQAGA